MNLPKQTWLFNLQTKILKIIKIIVHMIAKLSIDIEDIKKKINVNPISENYNVYDRKDTG